MATQIDLVITQTEAQLITDYLRPPALRAPLGHQEQLLRVLGRISDGYNVAVATDAAEAREVRQPKQRKIYQPGDEDLSDEDYDLYYGDGCP